LGALGSPSNPGANKHTAAAAEGGDSEERQHRTEQASASAEMKATVKGRFEGDKATAATTLAVPAAGDLRFKASATEAAFANGPSLRGLTLTLEKPGAFLIDLKPHNQDARFQFMNSALVLDKRVSLTYTHSTSLAPAPAAAPPSRTALDCSVTFDPANKVNFSHSLGSGGCRVKYTYAHGVDRLTTIEPLFDTNKNAWEFAVTRKFPGGDAVKGTYHASTKLLGLEWSRDSKAGGSFKVATTFDMSDQSKAPKLIAESTWNYEI
jgi:hypothetical protein